MKKKLKDIGIGIWVILMWFSMGVGIFKILEILHCPSGLNYVISIFFPIVSLTFMPFLYEPYNKEK